MHILVTNDDGVRAPGLLTLARELRSIATVTVLAPERNWSASGHVKTLHKPLRVWQAELLDGTPALTSDGAPSDCVALAMLGLIEEPIDLVVSGINPNANVGHDVTYSGTVTAAMEAVIAGAPGMAVSLDAPEYHAGGLDYEPAAQTAVSVIRGLGRYGWPKGVLFNVNIPHRPRDQMRGIRFTRQGLRVYRDALVRRDDPRGRPYYWIGGDAPSGVLEPGTDFWALAEGWVSITPLKLDLTDHAKLEDMQDWEIAL
jgi:5'-nucleotidase